jgi:hypothetical protein
MEPMLSDLLDCLFSHWSPALGDPHLMGWVTVGVYLLAAAATGALAVGGQFPTATARREKIFWAMASALLLALAINKQLDLQSALTAAARCLAEAQGWYKDRRFVQAAFILTLSAGSLVALLLLAALLRGTLRRTGLALLGLAFVTFFVMIRAAGFHKMDTLIDVWIGGVRLNWALELTGPLIVMVAVLLEAMRTRH